MTDMAEPLRRQMNKDLLVAMKTRDVVAVSALRSVLAALDNASAVPLSPVRTPLYAGPTEVPRKELSEADCRSIVVAEARARSAAADEYARLGQSDAATRLRAEQSVIERYVGSPSAPRVEG